MGRRLTCALGAAVLGAGGITALPDPATAGEALFAPYVAYDPGAGAASTAIGDVTGDGLADVVLTTAYDADPAVAFSLWVYPQQVGGSLGTPTRLGVEDAGSASGMDVALADLDEDGDLDVAVGTDLGVQLFAQEAGVLEPTWRVPSERVLDFDLVDVDDDDLADLVINAKSGVEVWWQVFGDFTSGRPGHQVTTYPVTEVEVGDVTGDGLADVVSALGRQVEVRAQRADHTFAGPAGYLSGGLSGWETVAGLALGDTTGDGRADVHTSGGGSRPTSWVATLPQLPDGTLGSAQRRTSFDVPETLESADVTGDGRDDLLVLHAGWNALGVYDSTPGTAGLETLVPVPHASHYGTEALAAGDVSSDGRVDVAVADPAGGLVLLRGGSGSTTDVTAPQTVVTGGPSSPLRSRTATVAFTADEPATFSCALDNESFTPCASPATWTGLDAGAHAIRVRARDAAGNVDTSPAIHTFTVDGPDTVITSGPTGTIRATWATFGFASSPTAAGYECRLGGAAYAPCTSPYTVQDLPTGTSQTFSVRAVSAEGLADLTPATRSFTVDAAADLGVTAAAAPTPAKRGGTLTWTSTVRNTGPGTATGVVLTQSVPAGVGGVTASATSNGTASVSCTVSSGTARCATASLGNGASVVLTVRATVTVAKGTLVSTAGVTSTTWDRVTTNDSATTSTKVGNGK